MCLSPDQMTSARLEEMVEYYRELEEKYPQGGYYGRQADMMQAVLKERAENGTYDEVPKVTPRHIH